MCEPKPLDPGFKLKSQQRHLSKQDLPMLCNTPGVQLGTPTLPRGPDQPLHEHGEQRVPVHRGGEDLLRGGSGAPPSPGASPTTCDDVDPFYHLVVLSLL